MIESMKKWLMTDFMGLGPMEKIVIAGVCIGVISVLVMRFVKSRK
jgi:hypothetical protein